MGFVYYTYVRHLHALYYRATDSQLNRSVESVRAEKSDIQVQLSKCQSELDDLIRTERRLKERYEHIHTYAS